MRDSVTGGVGGGQCLILAMLQRWKYDGLMMELTWGSNDRVGSRMRPRMQARWEGVIVGE